MVLVYPVLGIRQVNGSRKAPLVEGPLRGNTVKRTVADDSGFVQRLVRDVQGQSRLENIHVSWMGQ